MIVFDFHINLRRPFVNTLNHAIKTLKLFTNTSVSTVIIIDSYLKHVISSEMTIYEKSDAIKSLTQLLKEYKNLFIDQN